MSTDRQRGKRRMSPVSPLQAARLRRGWVQEAVAARVRSVCPGHAGRPCQMKVQKISMFETGAARPTAQHIAALAQVFQEDPEELGLIQWRTSEQRAQAERDLRARIIQELTERGEPPRLRPVQPSGHSQVDNPQHQPPGPPATLVTAPTLPAATTYLLIPVPLDAYPELPALARETPNLLQLTVPTPNGHHDQPGG